jgi:hypothetical protein
VLFIDLGSERTPSAEFLHGWWDRLGSSPFFDGICVNPLGRNFASEYPSAFETRPTEVPQPRARTFLWSQLPLASADVEFSGCPTGREARSTKFEPPFVRDASGRRVKEPGLLIWQSHRIQFHHNDIERPGKNADIGSNLAKRAALKRMW